MMDYAEIFFRWAFSVQMIFWGFNGFFQWLPVPPANPVIDRFVQACNETRFIMPTVKIFEIIFGVLLLFSVAIPLCLMAFAPIMLVITGLHALHNPKGFQVLVPLGIPYAVLILYHHHGLLRLVH